MAQYVYVCQQNALYSDTVYRWYVINKKFTYKKNCNNLGRTWDKLKKIQRFFVMFFVAEQIIGQTR